MPSERNILRKSIIEKLKWKNSIYGVTARTQLDQDQEEELLLMCYEEAEANSFREHLGKRLIKEIIRYNIKFNNKHRIDLR